MHFSPLTDQVIWGFGDACPTCSLLTSLPLPPLQPPPLPPLHPPTPPPSTAPPTPPSSPCSLPSQSTIALKYTQTASWPRRRRAGRKRWGHLSTDTWVKECFFFKFFLQEWLIRSRPSPRAWEADEAGRNGACGSHSLTKMQFSRWLCIVEGSAKLFPGASGSPLKVPKNKFVCKFKSKVRIKQFLTLPSSVPDFALVSVRRWRPSDNDYSVPFGCCLNGSAEPLQGTYNKI